MDGASSHSIALAITELDSFHFDVAAFTSNLFDNANSTLFNNAPSVAPYYATSLANTDMDIAPSHPTALKSTLVASSHATSLASTALDSDQLKNLPETCNFVNPRTEKVLWSQSYS